MASQTQVKQYLAYWLQLGKKVILNGNEALLPQPVVKGDGYSQEFEDCWQKIMSPDSGDCYLEGTDETIAQLLTPEWELVMCSRCELPLPLPTAGLPPQCCPCNNLLSWPNLDLPKPRLPVNNQATLGNIRDRLRSMMASTRETAENRSEKVNPAKMLMDLLICDCTVPEKSGKHGCQLPG
ncbi:MAG: hypothetical protein GDA56_10510 [Hormoscilla sp. GM7CHS1pb]|nr:hypothetical protein [Hormoscilla sp. GM7CHS1pb]